MLQGEGAGRSLRWLIREGLAGRMGVPGKALRTRVKDGLDKNAANQGRMQNTIPGVNMVQGSIEPGWGEKPFCFLLCEAVQGPGQVEKGLCLMSVHQKSRTLKRISLVPLLEEGKKTAAFSPFPLLPTTGEVISDHHYYCLLV